MKLSHLLFALLPALFVIHAQSEDEKNTSVTCKVTNVSDNGVFEKKHGFTFKEHPHIRYTIDANANQRLDVGALTFKTDDKSAPAKIDYSDEMNVVVIQAKRFGAEEIYQVAHTGRTGIFAYESHIVADIDCSEDP